MRIYLSIILAITAVAFITMIWNIIWLVVELFHGFDAVNAWRIGLVIASLATYIVFKFLFNEGSD